MRDNQGGAAQAVCEITSSAQQGAVDTLPQTIISTGGGDVCHDLCGRRDRGRSHLLGDSTAMAGW